MPVATVVIPTYDRAELLGRTLDRLAALRPALTDWEVLVADNNSRDGTRQAVESRAASFPVPLRYVFEPAQGRSHALNHAIAAGRAPVLLFTDDDVLVGDEWIDRGAGPLLSAGGVDYTGGPVRPLWESPCPPWLSSERGDLWGTIAILDYGGEPFVLEERRRVVLGANMAVRRSLFDRIGLFSTRLGRAGRRLLGQEVPEFLARARATGATGLYVPEMVVDHHVPAVRLTKTYFRRWWFGKGLSRAELDRLQPVTELGLDLSRVARVAGVPRFMLRSAAVDLIGWLRAAGACDAQRRFRHEAMLCYFAGYVAAHQRERHAARV